MFSNLGGWTGLILVVVVLLLFAAPKLPLLVRNLSQSINIFRKETKAEIEGDIIRPDRGLPPGDPRA